MTINPDHVEFAELATELIGENGSEMILRTETVSTGYPRTAIITDEPVTALREGAVTDKQIANDSRIKAGDINLLLDSSVPPTYSAQIIDGSREYQIVAIGEERPGDVSILWEVVARG